MAAYYLWQTQGALGRPLDRDGLERLVRLADRATDRERLLIRGLWARDMERPELLAIAETLAVRYPHEPDGPYAMANALLVNGRVLHGADFPRTRLRLARAGVTVVSVPAAELAKAEGGVTCGCLLVSPLR